MQALLFPHRLTTSDCSASDVEQTPSVLPASVFKKIFYDFKFWELGPIQESLIAYNISDINAIGFYILYTHNTKPLQDLIFNEISTEGSVLVSCKDSLELSLVIPIANLKRLPSHVQVTTSLLIVMIQTSCKLQFLLYKLKHLLHKHVCTDSKTLYTAKKI